MVDDVACPFVSRGGLKLAAALALPEVREAGLDTMGMTGVDLGCSVGGFTDCLLQHGCTHVHAVDTAYGQLAWTLRQDERVSVHERSNALHFAPVASCDIAVMDLGWTPQKRAIPAAMRWLKPGGYLVTLVKPHYEQEAPPRGKRNKAKLSDEEAERIAMAVRATLPELGLRGEYTHAQGSEHSVGLLAEIGWCISPIRGSKGGNVEYLSVLQRK